MRTALFVAGMIVGLGTWLGLATATGRVVLRVGGQWDDPAEPNESGRAGLGRSPGTPGIWAWTSAYRPVVWFAALAVAVVILTTSRLVVAAFAGAVAVLLIVSIFDARNSRAKALRRMAAATEFVESIRGGLGAGAGLEAAILEAAGRPPTGLVDELTAFRALAARPNVSTEAALRQLALQVDEPAVDMLVGSLIAALRGSTGEMGRLFDRIADQSRQFTDTRATTQAERAKVEFQTKVLSVVAVAVALLSVLVSPDLRSAYGPDLGGQLRLMVPVIIFAIGWRWLVRLNQVERSYRFRLRSVGVDGSGPVAGVMSS